MSSTKGTRRRRTAEDKMRIVLAGMEPGVEISELCRREGINPTQYYLWKKTLISSASRVFNAKSQKPSKKEERLETELSRCKDVIAEITAENLDLKKTLLD
ncbi:MAG: transposase [Pirellulales bacterium]|jgi:transposase